MCQECGDRARLSALTRHAAARHCDIQPATATLDLSSLSSVICDGLDSMRCRGRHPVPIPKTGTRGPWFSCAPAKLRLFRTARRVDSSRGTRRGKLKYHTRTVWTRRRKRFRNRRQNKNDDRSHSQPWWLNPSVHSAPPRGQICQHRAAMGSLSLKVAVVIWNRI